MKWPNNLTFIRHGESSYNALKKIKADDPKYGEFCDLFNKEYKNAKDENWASDELRGKAKEIWEKNKLMVGDYNTPLTKEGIEQAEKTGKELPRIVELPDVIYVSPYLRTRQTFEGLCKSWPDLKKVKTISEERIREQEHGLALVYNDWRLYYVFNPKQALLYKLGGDYEYRYVNGENKADVRDRVRSFLSTLIREHAEHKVFVVSHHLTLLCLRANLERWDREKFIDVDKNEKPINCGVTIYKGDPGQGKNGRLVLDTYNKKLF